MAGDAASETAGRRREGRSAPTKASGCWRTAEEGSGGEAGRCGKRHRAGPLIVVTRTQARRLGGSAARRLGGSAARRTIVTTPSSATVKGRGEDSMASFSPMRRRGASPIHPSRTRTNPATIAWRSLHIVVMAPPCERPPARRSVGPRSRQSSHIPSPPAIMHARRRWNAPMRARRSPGVAPPGTSDRRGEPRMPAAGRTSAAGRLSESALTVCAATGRLDALFALAPLEDRVGSEQTSRWTAQAACAHRRSACLAIDLPGQRGFHHRLRGVGPLERSPFVTARTASRKSGIGAGQAGKNVVKSVRWCRSPRTRCPSPSSSPWPAACYPPPVSPAPPRTRPVRPRSRWQVASWSRERRSAACSARPCLLP